MKVSLSLNLKLELYPLEQARFAEMLAAVQGEEVYCWKTVGRSNWLERRFSIADILGYVILPAGLPETIPMPDDPPERRRFHRRARRAR